MGRTTLSISEKFTSIQGEGQTAGTPAIFLRLSGCNLLCKSDSWICDTIAVWRKGTKTEFCNVLTDLEICSLIEGAHLVITGGEPLLHQKQIINYIDWLGIEYGFKPIIEIETNGTIMPEPSLVNIVDYWNCSPKLSNSGEPYNKRFNSKVLAFINDVCKNPMFKVVISSKEDVSELIDTFAGFIDLDKIYLMPAGENREQLEQTRLITIEAAIRLKVKFTDRLHIVAWDKKTGV